MNKIPCGHDPLTLDDLIYAVSWTEKKCCVLFKAASREQLFPDSGRFIDTLQSLQIEAAMHRQCYCWIVSEGKRCNNRRVTQKKNRYFNHTPEFGSSSVYLTSWIYYCFKFDVIGLLSFINKATAQVRIINTLSWKKFSCAFWFIIHFFNISNDFVIHARIRMDKI